MLLARISRVCVAHPAGPRRRGEGGNALIESAVSIIVYMLLLFGIVDFGRALYTYHFVSEAAREATRWAAVNGGTCQEDGSCVSPASAGTVQTYVQNLAPPGIDTSRLTANTYWPYPTGCGERENDPGCPVEVTVSYAFNFLVPMINASQITLSSTSQMVIAH
jgi:Flp pilus assembly protein TadG